MNPIYTIDNTSDVLSPGLLFYKDIIRTNIQSCLRIAGSPERLRPHVKTHKTREIVALQLAAGITKHKCATLAEAEMLASSLVPDVLVAYNLVGPNCRRLARLLEAFPATHFSVLADDPNGLGMLSAAIGTGQHTVDVLLDLDVGQHRTGIAPGAAAAELYGRIEQHRSLRPGGFHVYDGHNRQTNFGERQEAVKSQLEPVLALRDLLQRRGMPVPRLVLGGTPTFPVNASLQEPGIECSPGTFVLHDSGYSSQFTDLAGFTPAALVLTRVISRPTSGRITLDLGTKAIASDPPAGKRCILLNVPQYEPVIHNEEHFVIDTPQAERFDLGSEMFAVPTHICPTCALHKYAYVVEDRTIRDRWDIVARDRVLTV
jgi:D-serine deaminase-like pyridoxal phosphate-dependent protein